MKNLMFLLAINAFSYQANASTQDFKCQFTDDYNEVSYEASFEFKGRITVTDQKNATLSYVTVLDVTDFESRRYAGMGKDVSNVPYNGRKYKNYLKFTLELDSLRSRWSQASANLIILPLPVSTPESRGRVSYKAVLDVSFDDHHGDYIPLTCTSFY